MNKNKECLQLITGNCSGCNIQEIVREKTKIVNGEDKKQTEIRISEILCPEGVQIQLPQKIKQSIW